MKNAIKYSNILQETGLTKAQAEAHLQILEEIVDLNLATKSDIVRLESQINSLENNLESKIQNIEFKLVNKIGIIVTAAVAAVATFFKFFL